MTKDLLTQLAKGISLANARKTSEAQSIILFCQIVVNIMKAVMLNWKALVWLTTQRWKISTMTKLLREHLTLNQAKQMKGNFWSYFNNLAILPLCESKLGWSSRHFASLPSSHALSKILDTHIWPIFWPLLNVYLRVLLLVTIFFGQRDATDYTSKSLQAESNSCDTQIIFYFLLCDIPKWWR